MAAQRAKGKSSHLAWSLGCRGRPAAFPWPSFLPPGLRAEFLTSIRPWLMAPPRKGYFCATRARRSCPVWLSVDQNITKIAAAQQERTRRKQNCEILACECSLSVGDPKRVAMTHHRHAGLHTRIRSRRARSQISLALSLFAFSCRRHVLKYPGGTRGVGLGECG